MMEPDLGPIFRVSFGIRQREQLFIHNLGVPYALLHSHSYMAFQRVNRTRSRSSQQEVHHNPVPLGRIRELSIAVLRPSSRTIHRLLVEFCKQGCRI